MIKLYSERKYENISKLYNIECVFDNYIKLASKEKNIVYIYKITPTEIIDYNPNVINDIINIYTEFLRQMNYDFQVLIKNKTINIHDYLSLINCSKFKTQKVNNDLKQNYLNGLESILNSQNMYLRDYYIIISLNSNDTLKINELDNVIKIFERVGCKVYRLDNKQDILKLLYESFNKQKILNEIGVQNEYFS